jgi:hypothetical protein
MTTPQRQQRPSAPFGSIPKAVPRNASATALVKVGVRPVGPVSNPFELVVS